MQFVIILIITNAYFINKMNITVHIWTKLNFGKSHCLSEFLYKYRRYVSIIMLSKLLDVLNIKGYIILKILHMWAEGLLKIPKNKFIFKIIVCKLYLQWILNYYICYVFSVYDKKKTRIIYKFCFKQNQLINKS